MPIYEYECLSCGKQHEVIQRFDDEPLSTCPECGGHVRKMISNSAFVLKGNGWYITDYASGDRKKAMASEGKDSKAESKPESKTEAPARA